MSFSKFFYDVHGFMPFPWQKEAADRLISDRDLNSIAVPTGCGKTAMIDAALYYAAHGGPRRIFFIINRRVVVDEAAERASKIAIALNSDGSPILRDMAKKLGPIRVVRLRGGVHTQDDWVWHPEETVIVLSTVDQVGSRLLHRGYGVSPRMWPLHAGFVGNHALYLLDEAHISAPFASTVKAIAGYGADVRMLEMSATLKENCSSSLELSDVDRNHPLLSKVLGAKKLVSMKEIKEVTESAFVKSAAEEAEKLGESGGIIAVVVNQVRTARAIWKNLVNKKQRAELLIGRIRPCDKDQFLSRLLPSLKAGRKRKRGETLFIVATQTIEVGADFDFDGMVTEAAPLSALIQRFGRLDRRGELGETWAVILGRTKNITKETADKTPVYGVDTYLTWQWLHEQLGDNKELDFGILAMEKILSKVQAPEEGSPHCPQLLPPHVTLFAQTGESAPYFDPSPWLHGPQKRSTDVSVVWRADFKEEHTEEWKDRAQAFPPMVREAMQLPMSAVYGLLNDNKADDTSDIEGANQFFNQKKQTVLKSFLRWRGNDDCMVSNDWQQISPGDTIILPGSYGGTDQYGWDPKYNKPVNDQAELSSFDMKKGMRLRLGEGLIDWAGNQKNQLISLVNELRSAHLDEDPEEGVDEGRIEAAWEALKTLLAKLDHPFVKELGKTYNYQLLPREGLLLSCKTLENYAGGIDGGVPVLLEDHLEGVQKLARRLSAGYSESQAIVQAASLHDKGKQADAFQVMLHGDPIKAAGGPLLAKSGFRNRADMNRALRNSALPKGFRHELYSLSLTNPPDLITAHLIATHHGYGRPWFPKCEGGETLGADLIELRAGWAKKFADALKQKGPWYLAELETLLRASDIRCSQEEQGS